METADRAKGGETAKGETERVELDRAAQALVRRAAESKATVPHSYLRARVDVTGAVEIQLAFAAAAGENPVPGLQDMVIKATALALRAHPRANGSYRDAGLELYSRVNIGFSVFPGEALVFPTIVDADRLDLAGIAAERRRLSDEARAGQITAAGQAGGTFTVMDLGEFGVSDFDPVIHGGQAGMLGIGEPAERPLVRDGELTTGRVMEISLACDHRILYGSEAAGLLAAIRSNLEQPDRLT
jgi:pyruvate dehydrogenase E2 component (dihydrolipoamide acetyltransferase)